MISLKRKLSILGLFIAALLLGTAGNVFADFTVKSGETFTVNGHLTI